MPTEPGTPSPLAHDDLWLALARINAKVDRLVEAHDKSVLFTAETLLRIEEAIVELRGDFADPGDFKHP